LRRERLRCGDRPAAGAPFAEICGRLAVHAVAALQEREPRHYGIAGTLNERDSNVREWLRVKHRQQRLSSFIPAISEDGDLAWQVRIEGAVQQVSREEAEDYFRSRPYGSQLAAWSSEQSGELPSRRVSEARWQVLSERYPPGAVPLPPFWGGYRLRPQPVEFWQGREDRLHDRFLYRYEGAAWTVRRLYP